MEIQQDILGWIALIIVLLSCSYILLKRLKMYNSSFKLNLRKFLGWHCYLGIISTIIAFVHVGNNLYTISFSVGYISLFSMFLLSISGIILKYLKGLPLEYKRVCRYIHIILTIIFAITLILHILEYHLIY